MNEKETLRIAAVAYIHTKKTSQGTFQPLFQHATENADVLLLCGDLTDFGAVEEAKGNAPVYNVAMPLLAASFADRQPVKIIEVPVGEATISAA